VNVLLVAEESAGIQVLRMLASTPHSVSAVMTAPPTRGGGASVASVADSLGVPVLPSAQVREAPFAGWIREREVDLLLNVHSLHVIHADVVGAPRIGSFNLHPGRLPDYAGLNAPSWAIYMGEKRHAVTVHWMEADIDAGAIAYESHFDIGAEDTGLSLSARCVKEGLPLLARVLEAAEGGREAIPAEPQDLARRRYLGRQVPEQGRIVWSRPPREVVDLVRACDYFPFPSPWGHPYARLGERPLTITKASRTGERATAEPGTVGAPVDDGVRVAAGTEWIVVQRVQVNGRSMAAAEVLDEGMRLGDGA
jgi:UDP-4-amino-4-deoxy-L-arabinose formyltransferase/UDP-glucuronic acid dehydrogenase (UDP-4-keto-hexauronic acid decarboxylating)